MMNSRVVDPLFGGMHGTGMGWVYQLIILILFFLVVYWLVKDSGNKGRNESALDVLKRRLASGEITEKEYHRIKKEIQEK